MSEAHFADRLNEAICRKGTPLVVGLDPRFEKLPWFEPDRARPSWEEQARQFSRFSIDVIDAVADLVPAVKPQAAFFEQLGPAGMLALAEVVAHAGRRGLLVIMDAKRGDIGSTAEAYAAAWLDRSPQAPWGRCDALTVNPWLGDDSLVPFVDFAREQGSGVFILCRTSNPGSRMIQELRVPDRPLFELVGDQIQALAAAHCGASGYGHVGAVVGATHPVQLASLRQHLPNVLFLVPGLGAQGGTAADIAGAFDSRGLGAIVNSSRAIIFAYHRPEFTHYSEWQRAVESATRETIEELDQHTAAGQLRKKSSTSAE